MQSACRQMLNIVDRPGLYFERTSVPENGLCLEYVPAASRDCSLKRSLAVYACCMHACVVCTHCVSSMPIVADRSVCILGDERECVCF